ncbi:cyclic peptide export ABC transporter [Xenorhabdus budapestensis]|uniref:Cyclic peptide export ABC transporter n=1 Tax=Xenorhabdus budapestensis TaxID=290110 RepID=A0A2D0J0K6_XENBU|nr:cyclic peptide export ABC transporter [Xenorhabdus budapestensis]PHM27775.1 Cyclic peptide transporter [Xenorhabdus budapestensis]QTL38437.1 cyclic peptide export ABC transporter [Xenorhabdus budapestensis]
MTLIAYLYRQSWILLLLSTIFALISGFTGASVVGMISQGITGAVSLSSFIWNFFGICILFFITKTLSEVLLSHLTQATIYSLRLSLSNKILRAPFKKLNNIGKHGLLAVLTKDVDVFIHSFMLAPTAFGNITLIIACFGYLAWISWQLFIILTVVCLLTMYIFYFLEKRPIRLMEEMREQVDKIYLSFQQLIDGSKELKLNSQKGNAFIDRVISPGAKKFKEICIKANNNYAWVLNAGSVVFYIVIGFMIFVVPIWLPQEPSNLMTVTLIVLFLSGPISELIGAIPELRQAEISLQKMKQLDSELEESLYIQQANTPNPFANEQSLSLELKDVVHHYTTDKEDREFKLGPMSLTISQGEIIFIVGGNGSGKTTLAMLLVGLFEQESGSIWLNGVKMDQTNNEHYRQYFAAVFSNYHLFDQLLNTGANVTEKATHYIEALNMSHKVKIVDGQFSTTELSAGQRKRLALVSAYLEDRPIYLFDEWAADQDPVFKRIFYTELLPELKARGKTVIVISHDDAYFDIAERVIKLEDGHIKEVNTNSHHSG